MEYSPTITLDTWIVSDTHFLHKNIVKYCNRPMSHNQLMEANWHALVEPEDTILHLGDLMVWYNDLLIAEAKEIAARLPGKKLILRGNHDKLSREEFAELGFVEISEFIQKFGDRRVLFSHYPAPNDPSSWDLNVHGHIHNNDHRDEDGRIVNSNRHINVSIEVMDYKPVRLKEILNVQST